MHIVASLILAAPLLKTKTNDDLSMSSLAINNDDELPLQSTSTGSLTRQNALKFDDWNKFDLATDKEDDSKKLTLSENAKSVPLLNEDDDEDAGEFDLGKLNKRSTFDEDVESNGIESSAFDEDSTAAIDDDEFATNSAATVDDDDEVPTADIDDSDEDLSNEFSN